ncbi:MAG: PucR family transcriptional regulator [Glaciihabitans sp.]|nr:PucR family transcriptional regulator [Glaciihabitans sp.]
MVMSIRDIFEDAYFFASEPTVVAGFADLDRPVRWVHASEMLEIAPLLRGGELVLMEAVNLAEDSADDAVRARYIASLNDAGIAALAIELTGRMPAIPQPMIDSANALGLPLIAMKRRIPFVQICESINTQLADSSLIRLRLADSMSIALSETVRELTEIPAMLAVLSAQTHAEVVLMSLAGEEIGRAEGAGGAPLQLSFSAPVSFGGTVVAYLTLRPREEADIYLINAALERAPELLAIALLQVQPPTAEERLAGQFFALLDGLRGSERADAESELRLVAIAERLGVPDSGAFFAVIADLSGDIHSLPALRQLLAKVSAGQLSQLVGTDFVSILWFDDRHVLDRARTSLRRTLQQLVAGGAYGTIAIGPGGTGRGSVAREVAAARGAIEVVGNRGEGVVVDAREQAVARLVQSLDSAEVLSAFLGEHLGALREVDPELVVTIAALVDNWGSKTAAAEALGLQRQTLHQRIKRIEAVVGPLSMLGARTAPLIIAALLGRVMGDPSPER